MQDKKSRKQYSWEILIRNTDVVDIKCLWQKTFVFYFLVNLWIGEDLTGVKNLNLISPTRNKLVDIYVLIYIYNLYLFQYYDDTYPTVKEQKAFEKNIFNKTHRTDSK